MADTKLTGIYCIRNLRNGKRYVGSAVDIANRWAVHRCGLRRGAHHSSWLQRAWNKHGADQFVFEILERVQDREALIAREQFWLESLKAYQGDGGYNVCPVAQSRLGRRHTAKAKKKISAAHTGRKHTVEARARMSEAQRKRSLTHPRGPVSEETRRKIGLASKGRLTPEIAAMGRAAMIKARKGMKLPDAWRAAMSKARTGVPWTEGQRTGIMTTKRATAAKLLPTRLAAEEARKAAVAERALTFGKNGQLGKKHTPETIAKMRETRARQPPISEAARAKISKANTGRKHTAEAIQRRIEALADWRPTEQQMEAQRKRGAAVGAANRGKTHSEQARKNMSLGQTGRKRSDAARANMKKAWELRKLLTAQADDAANSLAVTVI